MADDMVLTEKIVKHLPKRKSTLAHEAKFFKTKVCHTSQHSTFPKDNAESYAFIFDRTHAVPV